MANSGISIQGRDSPSHAFDLASFYKSRIPQARHTEARTFRNYDSSGRLKTDIDHNPQPSYSFDFENARKALENAFDHNINSGLLTTLDTGVIYPPVPKLAPANIGIVPGETELFPANVFCYLEGQTNVGRFDRSLNGGIIDFSREYLDVIFNHLRTEDSFFLTKPVVKELRKRIHDNKLIYGNSYTLGEIESTNILARLKILDDLEKGLDSLPSSKIEDYWFGDMAQDVKSDHSLEAGLNDILTVMNSVEVSENAGKLVQIITRDQNHFRELSKIHEISKGRVFLRNAYRENFPLNAGRKVRNGSLKIYTPQESFSKK